MSDVTGEAIAPFDLVIFGGSGDLAMRKLLPALYHRSRSGELPDDGVIIGLGRRDFSNEQYRENARAACERHVQPGDFNTKDWTKFSTRLSYQALDATRVEDYTALAGLLGNAARTRVFYLATAPSLFTTVCKYVAQADLVTPASRVVLEKPIGRRRLGTKSGGPCVTFAERPEAI